MSDFLSNKLMEMLQARARGRENAVTRDELLYQLGLFRPNLGDRKFREMYAGLPVCSCVDGLFIPVKPQEVLDFKAYLEKQVGPIIAARRVAIIYAFYPKLRPPTGEQLRMFG